MAVFAGALFLMDAPVAAVKPHTIEKHNHKRADQYYWLRERDDLPFVGLIGSKSKWATFGHRLEARGFAAEEIARVTCPIGVPGVRGKEPEVIAAAVAAQLMQLR